MGKDEKIPFLYVNQTHLSTNDLFDRICQLGKAVGIGLDNTKKLKWDDWLGDNEDFKKEYPIGDKMEGGGISYSNISKIYKDTISPLIQRLAQNKDPEIQDRHLRKYIRQFEKYLRALYAYRPDLYIEGSIRLERDYNISNKDAYEETEKKVPAVETTKESFDEANETVTNSPSDIKSSSESEKLVWYVYFLHFVKKGQKKEIPKIARTVLTAYDNNKAELKNLVDEVSKNYAGKWAKLAHPKLYSFDLWWPSEDDKQRHLHFKVEFGAGDRILFGSYTTYDSHSIHSGKLLFERISSKRQLQEQITPLAISHVENLGDFEQIDENIIEYLSLSKDNHINTPEPLGNIKLLQDWVDDINPFNSPEKRFFDPLPPRLFIASPKTSLSGEERKHEEFVEKIYSDIENKFGKDLEVRLRKHDMEAEELASYDNLKYLEKTKFFILVLNSTNQASFSLVQLGWAMAHCKHCMVVFNPNNVSSRFSKAKNVGFVPREYNDPENEYNEIIKDILDFIQP